MNKPTDYLGNELSINDEVVYTKSGTGTSYFCKGLVVDFTPKNVRIHKMNHNGDLQQVDSYNWHLCLKSPDKIIKI